MRCQGPRESKAGNCFKVLTLHAVGTAETAL